MDETLARNCEIKKYICKAFAEEEEDVRFARENSLARGLKEIQVPSNVGKLIYLLAKLRAPKRALEIGTLGGYSTLWLAKALPQNGRLISLEFEAKHAAIAKEHIVKAGFSAQVEIRIGKAADLLSSMIASKEEPFDLIFIDADKENYPKYLDLAYSLSTSGTLILSDNLIPKGEKIDDPHPNNEEACSIYHFNKLLSLHPKIESIITTNIVGEKGRLDGLGISLVT